MARKTLAERRNEAMAAVEAAKRRVVELEAEAAERIGRIAMKSGLVDLDISDDQLAKEFDAIASKFRPTGKKQAAPRASAASEG